MSEMKETKITFNTITPIWTGDAWGENTEIKPASIMGSLRFWFYIYRKTLGIETNHDGVPSDNIDDYVKKYNKNNHAKETFNSLLVTELEKSDFKNALKKTLEKISLPLSSIIFGCTGWKSQVQIKVISCNTKTIKKSEIDFSYLYNRINSKSNDSKFWSNKLLFNDKDKIKAFANIKFELKINLLIYQEIKDFFKFYENKVILLGGKKSFGFGFCKIKTDLDLNDIRLGQIQKKQFGFKEIDISDLPDNKIILGFNFKHYQRLRENKSLRENNFGKQSQASNFFFSTKQSDQNSIYMIAFNEPPVNTFEELLNRYSDFQEKKNG